MRPPPCIHSPDGATLCPTCQAECDEDPQAYLEFGDHPAGIANWQDLQAEMAEAWQADRDAEEAAARSGANPTPPGGSEIPF